ncbi:nuclear transport factor 2 family protein [Congregibacter sp.]|uniref:nuclear transport factor 2 family protein n=1 Tax=Congregibacter sp. TaxID=2744308 RepID=UPI003F6C235E
MRHFGKALAIVLAGLSSANALAQDCSSAGVSKARTAFNHAIRDDDLDAMARIFDDNLVLVTGSDSDVYLGRDRQLEIWRSDVSDPNRLRYVRETTAVEMSPLYPIAMESGLWTGSAPGGDEVGGQFTAKWRCDDGQWRLEAEIFMTTRCSNSLCD